MLLLDENDPSLESSSLMPIQGATTPATSTPPTKVFKPKSQHFPDLTTNPRTWAFLIGTINDIKHVTILPGSNNLTPSQIRAIQFLRSRPPTREEVLFS